MVSKARDALLPNPRNVTKVGSMRQTAKMCVGFNVRSQAQGQVLSPSFFLLSRPFGSARHHAKVAFSRLTWVDLLCPHFPPRLQERIASAIPLLSYNTTSNAKYFAPPTDVLEPPASGWDGEHPRPSHTT